MLHTYVSPNCSATVTVFQLHLFHCAGTAVFSSSVHIVPRAQITDGRQPFSSDGVHYSDFEYRTGATGALAVLGSALPLRTTSTVSTLTRTPAAAVPQSASFGVVPCNYVLGIVAVFSTLIATAWLTWSLQQPSPSAAGCGKVTRLIPPSLSANVVLPAASLKASAAHYVHPKQE